MSINQVLLNFERDVPVSRLENRLEIGSSTGKGDAGVEKVLVRFHEHYLIEVKKDKKGQVLIIMTSGGVSKEIDLQTFHQLIAMNY
ncbi:MAG: hypothetical protein QHH10_05885 [Peptococcaceae bacterium]|jgi:hypothetical protein|nr:hypothetical protein [Peptococcaceae bacterium]MDH7524832.1 hypothetical protein [Peptococcaceae bacterium]